MVRQGQPGKSREAATVWAAEHGASTRDLSSDVDEDGGANVGHRFRIHGRLEEGDLEGGADPGGALDDESLRQLVARQSEIDVRDVQFLVEGDRVTLTGTVAGAGERQALEELLVRVPAVRSVRNQLRIQTA